MSTTTATTTNNPAKPVQVVPNGQDNEDSFSSLSRGDRAGKIRMQGIPTFSDPLKKRQWMKQHMAAAFRYFGKNGYGEGVSGHISMRGKYIISLLVVFHGKISGEGDMCYLAKILASWGKHKRHPTLTIIECTVWKRG